MTYLKRSNGLTGPIKYLPVCAACHKSESVSGYLEPASSNSGSNQFHKATL